MRTKIPLLLVLVSLAACNTQSDIQRDYAVAQAECQDVAESDIDQFLAQNTNASVADRNSQMVTLFSQCMTQRGWQLGKTKKPAEVANAPAGSPGYLPNQPSATATAAAAKPAQPAAASAAQPAAAGAAPSGIANEPTSAPSVPQSAGGSAPATYQPSYGSGPGRGF